jgi:hypothetical protein
VSGGGIGGGAGGGDRPNSGGIAAATPVASITAAQLPGLSKHGLASKLAKVSSSWETCGALDAAGVSDARPAGVSAMWLLQLHQLVREPLATSCPDAPMREGNDEGDEGADVEEVGGGDEAGEEDQDG